MEEPVTTNPLDDYLDDAELAASLGVSVFTVLRWRRLGEAPPSAKVGSRRITRRVALRDWLLSREQAA